MYKIKIICEKTPPQLEAAVNRFFNSLTNDMSFLCYRLVEISYNNDYTTAAITYAVENHSKSIDTDDEYFEDNDDEPFEDLFEFR